RAVVHGGAIRLLRRLLLDRSPFEETINRQNAPAAGVGVPKARQRLRGLGLRVSGLAPTLRVSAPVRNQPPAQQIERALAGRVVLPDDEQLLAGRTVVAAGHVREPAVAHVVAIADREPQRTGGLT